MRDLLDQIERGLQANLYYLSFLAALAVPDICAALSSADGQTTGARYAGWFDSYVAPKYNGRLCGSTCYQLRCSLFHQGSLQHPSSTYARVLFVEPSSTSRIVLHNNVLNDALNIDVRIFCRDIIGGANSWLMASQSTPNYQKNFLKLMQRYPNGLSPYIVGVPVIG